MNKDAQDLKDGQDISRQSSVVSEPTIEIVGYLFTPSPLKRTPHPPPYAIAALTALLQGPGMPRVLM